MKKHLSIVSMLGLLALSLAVASCGSKRDEALVTEFNSQKTAADKALSDAAAQAKTMTADHAAWTAKLDSVAKLPKADTAKINAFKDQMKKMDAPDPATMALADSLKAYGNAKTDNNDELNAAIAGLKTNLASYNATCSTMMQAEKQLGTNITAFLTAGAPQATVAPAAKPAAKKMAKKPAAKPAAKKPVVKQRARRGTIRRQ